MHWTERGQLHNAGQLWRQRRRKKSPTNDGNDDERHSSIDIAGPTSPVASESDSSIVTHQKSFKKNPTRRKKRKETLVDMYMALDGSAMRAIGKLIPELSCFFFQREDGIFNPPYRHVGSGRDRVSLATLGGGTRCQRRHRPSAFQTGTECLYISIFPENAAKL